MSNAFTLTNPAWSLTQPQRQQTTSGFATAPGRANVNYVGVNPQLMYVANEVGNQLSGQLKRPLLITSARDSTHTPGSQHYGGNAFDMRTRDLNAQQRAVIVEQFRARGMTAVDEGDHIHVAMPRGYNPAAGPGTVGRDLQLANAAAPGAAAAGASGPADLPAIANMTSPFDTASDDSLGSTLGKAAADDGMTETASTRDPTAFLRDPRTPTLSDALMAANAEQQAPPVIAPLDETAPLFNIKKIGQAKLLKQQASLDPRMVR